MDLRPGKLINRRWKVVRPLSGTGATKQVFLVEDAIQDALAGADVDCADLYRGPKFGALKVRKSIDGLPTSVGAVVLPREINLLRAMNESPESEGLVRLLDVGLFDRQRGSFFYIEEFVEGEKTFEDESFTRKVRECVGVGREISAALGFIHNFGAKGSGRGIIHGDVKPGNIMITSEGRALLGDFGSARIYVDEAKPFVPGSIRYRAPEVFDGRILPVSDVYSLGVSLYHQLTGSLPFKSPVEDWAGLNADQIREQRRFLEEAHKSQKQVPVSSLNRDVPKKISNAIDSAMNKDPKNRPSAREFNELLGGGKNEPLWWNITRAERGEKEGDEARATRYRSLLETILGHKILPVVDKLPKGKFPYIINNGQRSWSVNPQNAAYWSSGRFPGLLWMGYEITGDIRYRTAAERMMGEFAERFDDRKDGEGYLAESATDLADISYTAFLPAIRLGGKKEYDQFVERSASSLRSFFDPRGFFRSTNETEAQNRLTTGGTGLILPFLVTRPEFRPMVNRYLELWRKHNLREDGSVAEIVEIAENGESSVESQVYGFNGGDRRSHLARDHGLALRGLVAACESMPEGDYIDLAMKVIGYVNRKEDEAIAKGIHLPIWDFGIDNGATIDSSAAAEIARARLKIAKLHPSSKVREDMKVRSFRSIDYMIDNHLALGADYEGTLTGGFRSIDQIVYQNCSTIFGDYSFCHALREALEIAK